MTVREATAAHYDHVLHRTNRRCPQMASDNHRQGFCFAEEERQPVHHTYNNHTTTPYKIRKC